MFRWFESRLDPYPAQAPQMPPRGLWRFMLHFTQGAHGYMLAMAACSALIAVAEVVLFGYLGDLVDRMSGADRAGFWADEGGRLILMGAILMIGLPLLQTLFSLLMHQTLMGNLPQRIRWQAHRYLLRQSMSYFQDEFAGRIATKLMQTALAVREVAMKFLDVLVYVAVYFIGAIVLAASTDGWLALPFLAWGLAYGVLLWWLIPRIGRVSEAQADARAVMTGRVVDSYTNILSVKLFAHAEREDDFVRSGLVRQLSAYRAVMRAIFDMTVALTVLNSLLLLAMTALAIHLWLAGSISAGAIAVATGLIIRLTQMSGWILRTVTTLFENIGTIENGIETISKPHGVTDRPRAPELVVTRGAIRFEEVRFHYGKEGGVIENLSLDIRPGEKVGLVGRSGAGKSTLVNLLLRFYDLEGGRILIDGTDISTVTQSSLRAHVGVVSQDTGLLHRSIADNIRYGRPDATREDMVRAARLAAADGFIDGLSDQRGRGGYDVLVGERGVKLSGGQRQRIAIARVILKDAPILVLDEATSALDSEVEAVIQEQLKTLMEGKTVIAIAHRLSTIAALDRLVVMDGGRIVEEGSHRELVRRGGLYARLWERQSGGFLGLPAE